MRAFARRVSSRLQGTGAKPFPCLGKQKPCPGPALGTNRVRARLKCRHKPGARLAHRRCARKAKGAKLSFSSVSVRWGRAGTFSLPGKTGAVRGHALGKNRVRARLKCRHKPGARLARRSRAGKRWTGRTALRAADALQAAPRVTSLPAQTALRRDGACASCSAQPRVRARHGEEKDLVRVLPGAAAGFLPAAGNRNQAFSLPGKTGAVRGPAPGTSRVRARFKCRHKPERVLLAAGARLARRRRYLRAFVKSTPPP